MTMNLIKTITVGVGGAATMSFTGIPQTGKDLYLVVSSRGSTNDDFLNMTLNGSSAGFTGLYLGTNVNSSFTGTNVIVGFTNESSQTASVFANADVYIPNYTAAQNKTFSTNSVQENNATTNWMFINAGLWSNTAAITSLSLTLTGTNIFVQNSTASLYTISTTGATGADAGIFGYDFTTGVQGWTGTGATVSATGGILTFSPTANDPNFISPSISMSGAAGRYLNMTFKRNNAGQSSSWDGTIFYATAGHGYDGNYRKTFSEPVWDGQYKTVRLDMHALDAGGTDWATSTITSVRIDFSNASADGAFLVDTIWFD